MEKRNSNKGTKIYGVYIRSVLNQKVSLLITEIGQNVRQILEQKLIQENENKCIREGFIKPGSVNIIQYSSGLVNAEWIVFETVFECMVCHPVEGMLIECVVKTITKAGIHAEVIDGDAVPVVVFVAKDHHNMNKYFNSVVENQRILVKVMVRSLSFSNRSRSRIFLSKRLSAFSISFCARVFPLFCACSSYKYSSNSAICSA